MEQPAIEQNLKPVFFTFDDGPAEPYTSEILELLEIYGAKATFFVCGKNALRFPEITKKIVASGHSLGNHSYSHPFVKSFFGLLKDEISQTDEILHSLTGARPTLMRPPWGFAPKRLKKYLSTQGYRLVLWDIMAYDWFKPPASYMANRILKKLKAKSVVLLHDGYNTKEKVNRANTVKALKIILPQLKNLGFYAEKIV